MFGGWTSLPKYRPLVIISSPNYKDPERWKPYKFSKDEIINIYPYLRVAIGRHNAYECEYGKENYKVPFEYGAEDVLVNKSYKSKSGSVLVSVGISEIGRDCEGAQEKSYARNWFLIKNNTVDFIGKDMDLVDAGDYDNDGKVEFMFWYSAYNKDGYVLMYDDFRQSASYIWNYH